MSYEFTKLSEVPAVSEFPEGANAIIETNGEIKRCPSSGGSSVPKPLTYDYMPEGYPKKSVLFNIEWDGNTDGLPSAIFNSNIIFYKVSDMVPTNDELTGGTFILSGGVEVISITSDMITTPSVDLRMVSEYIVIVQKENATLGNMLFPQTGTYFYKGTNTGNYITRLSKQTVTPMAEEFLPNIPADKLPAGAGGGGMDICSFWGADTFHCNKTYLEVCNMYDTSAEGIFLVIYKLDETLLYAGKIIDNRDVRVPNIKFVFNGISGNTSTYLLYYLSDGTIQDTDPNGK